MRRLGAVLAILSMVFLPLHAFGTLTSSGRLTYRPRVITSNTRSYLIDAAAEKTAMLLQAACAGDIAKVYIRLGTVGEEDGLTIALQNVTGSNPATPDGTDDQTCSFTFTDTDDNTWQSCTLGSARTVAVGDQLAVVVKFTSWVDGNLSIVGSVQDIPTFGNSYVTHCTGACASWSATGENVVVGLEYSGTTYCEHELTQFGLGGTNSYNTGSTPDEIGNYYAAWPVDCRLVGVWYEGRLRGNPSEIVVYDSGSSVLTSVVPADDLQHGDAGFIYRTLFTTPIDLESGSEYRIVVKPTSGSSVDINYLEVPVAAALGQWPSGAYGVYTSRVNAGGWTQTSTRLDGIYPICDKFHDDSGGGSGGVSRSRTQTGGQ